MAQSQMGAIGIDFGSSLSVIAVAQRGGVQTIANEGSNRETPNVVVYNNNERYIGEAGISPNAPFFPQERKWITSRLVPWNNDKGLAYQVSFQGENKILPVEQVTAAMLGNLKTIIQKFGVQHSDYVISVPSYYTEQERKAFLEAARLADIKVMRLFSESSAIALSYGIFRKKELKDSTRNVMFIDFGQSKLSCFVAKFTGTNLKVLAQKNERNLGVRDIDYTLLEYYCNDFYSKTGIAIMDSPKAKLRLLQAIEKQRKMLSAGPDAQIHCEYLIEEEDFDAILSREQFQQLIKEVIFKLQQTIQALKDECEEKKIAIDDIELVGGGTRIPVIITSIEEVMKKQALRTMNSSECIARGCAMMAAIISPMFQVTEYTIDEINYYPIRCAWSFGEGKIELENADQTKKTSAILFNKDCSIPNIKSLTFQKNEGLELALMYDPAPNGFESLLAKYSVEKGKLEEQEFNIKVRIKLDINGIVQLEDVALNQDYWEDIVVKKEEKKEEKKVEKQEEKEKVVELKKDEKKVETATEDKKSEIKPPEEAKIEINNNQMMEEKPKEPEPEIQKKKKTKTSLLKTHQLLPPAIEDKIFQKLYSDECQMGNQDRIVRETYDKRNELESYIYEMRQKLSDQLAIYCQESLKTNFIQQLEQEEQWLYQEGVSVSKSVYQDKIIKLRNVGDKIVNRAKEYHMIPEKLMAFAASLKEFEELALSKDEKYIHIEEKDRQLILTEIAKHRNWMAQKNNEQKDVPKYKDPVISVKEVEDKLQAFIYLAKPIMSKPKPEPPKVEKKEEKKEETNGEKMEQQKAEEVPKDSKPGNSPATPMEVE